MDTTRSPEPRNASGRKAIVTMGSGPHSELLDIALPTFTRFAEKFGYDIVIGTGLEAHPRPTAWSKIPLLARSLASYELVLWLDADTVIVSFDADPADYLEPSSYQALVVHKWRDERRPNTGVWLLRSSPRAWEFLEAVWASEQYIDDHWWENAAVVNLLGYSMWPCLPGPATEWVSGTVFLDEDWNSLRRFYGTYPGRIRHYAGRPLLSRRLGARADILHLAALDNTGIRALLLQIRSKSARVCSEGNAAWDVVRKRQRRAVSRARKLLTTRRPKWWDQ